MIRGTSGAVISYDADNLVKKTGDARVRGQGLWLVQHESPALPAVHTVHERKNAYIMERLSGAPPWALNHRAVLDRMLLALNMHVWCRPARVVFDPDVLASKLDFLGTYLLDEPKIIEWTTTVSHSLSWGTLSACLAHGDPTFENVMFRDTTGDVVIIDPLPASPAVPDLLSVDLGKMLQSVVGWERVRYSDPEQSFHVTARDLRLHIPSDDEWHATVFWCVVHLLRTLPYVEPDIRPGVIGCAYDAAGLL